MNQPSSRRINSSTPRLSIVADPVRRHKQSKIVIGESEGTDSTTITHVVDGLQEQDGTTTVSIHGYHIAGQDTLTRDSLLATTSMIHGECESHYRDVILRVSKEPGVWPIANSAYIVWHTATSELCTINEGEYLIPLMAHIKDAYGKHHPVMIISVILRELGECDVYTV